MKSFNQIIKNGGVAVIRTDTLYGIVCDAFNQHAVERIYHIKNRNPLKPVIVLVADYKQIALFGVSLSEEVKEMLSKYWPGKVSVILPASDTTVNTHYIHKGTGGIAFRIPDDEYLQKRLIETGPLVAPSANPEGKPPARSVNEAIDYFGDKVDYYEDKGTIQDIQPSKIIKISNTVDIEIIRD